MRKIFEVIFIVLGILLLAWCILTFSACESYQPPPPLPVYTGPVYFNPNAPMPTIDAFDTSSTTNLLHVLNEMTPPAQNVNLNITRDPYGINY